MSIPIVRDFAPILNAALEAYKHKTKNDLASHPLLPKFQSCDSPEATLAVFREQIPAYSRFENSDDRLTKWVTPTVNVLYSFSTALGGDIGLAFSPVNIIFVGMSVLLLATEDGNSRDKLIGLFIRMEHSFRRLEVYTSIIPTVGMTDVIVDIMVEVLSILAIATKEAKSGRLNTYFKKFIGIGSTDIEKGLRRLDRLTQEARMASAERGLIPLSPPSSSIVRRRRSAMSVVVDVQYPSTESLPISFSITNPPISEEPLLIESTTPHSSPDSPVVNEHDKPVPGPPRDGRRDAHGVDSRVQVIADQLDQVNRNHLRDQLLRWLSPPVPSTNQSITRSAHHNGTSRWFIHGSIYGQWKSSGSFLWVRGKPGSGKSVLCSLIIEDIMTLRDAGRASMAYFYFDFRDVNKQSLHNLLSSLLCQLSARSDPFCDILSRLYSAHNRGELQPDDHAMMDCLKEMFSLEAQEPTYIIMDALDECPNTTDNPSPRERLLNFVDELVHLQFPNLHICVTSRLEHDIQASLEHLTERPVTLHNESGQKQDIADYVTSFVYSNERMRRWRQADKDLVIDTLLERANGMYRWVFCQLDALQVCLPPSIRRVLEELPEGLDETYERILREIRKPYEGHARRLLHCLAASVRPLRVEELAEVLLTDFDAGGTAKLNPAWRLEDQARVVLSACSSLVVIVEDGDSRVVQFSHFSLKEFLTSDRLATSNPEVSRFHVQLETAHTILAQACLGIFPQLDNSVDRDNINDSPLARYAAQHWATHARFGNASPHIKDEMECLFDEDKPHFATWLWIYNEDRGGRSMSTIRPEEPEAFPLYYAARLGFQDLVEHLLVKRPEVNARGGREMTPMHAAASGGHANILRLLQEHGADVGSWNKYGETPLHGASWNGKLNAGRCLLDLGADINAQNEDDWTPLFHAVFHGHTEFARMLLERGAAIEARSVFGSTPLHAAVRGGGIQAVQLLLEYGADVNARDNRGWTASRWKSTKEIVKLLAEYGAESG